MKCPDCLEQIGRTVKCPSCLSVLTLEILDERTCDNCAHGPLRPMADLCRESLDNPDGPDSPCISCMRAQPYADLWRPNVRLADAGVRASGKGEGRRRSTQ